MILILPKPGTDKIGGFRTCALSGNQTGKQRKSEQCRQDKYNHDYPKTSLSGVIDNNLAEIYEQQPPFAGKIRVDTFPLMLTFYCH